jgi:hemolysin III
MEDSLNPNAESSLAMNGRRSSRSEELADILTSGAGLVLAFVGAVVLVALASQQGTVWHIVSSSIYASTLIFLYTASTLYHSRNFPNAKLLLRLLDHAGIFLLIAGTYTPFVLVNLRGAWGWSLFGVVWGLATLGIAFQTRLLRWPVVRIGLYIGMGWAVVVAIKPLCAAVAPGGLVLLLVGGAAYTLGLGFFAWRRLAYHHAIWHVFVLMGSMAHFFAIFFYVLPAVAFHGTVSR